MKIEITRNNKEFTVLDKNTLILKGRRPKWYSSELRFFHNSKTYEIKKKGFWSSSFIILESGHPIGAIHWSLKKSYKIILKNNPSSPQYWLKKEKVGKWYAADRKYLLCENGETPILTIHYALKKWKESIEAEFIDKDTTDYVLLICALFIMKLQQSAENAAVGASGF